MSRGALPIVLVLSTLVACGVPVDDDPRPIAGEELPGDLVSPSTSTSSPPTEGTAMEEVALFFVRGGLLVATTREVASPATLTRALATLLAGPDDREAAQGLRSALPAETELLGLDVRGRVAVVDLSRDFTFTGDEQVLALAQLVFTATSRPGVEHVIFLVEGEPVQVPTADGNLESGAVGRQQFASLYSPEPAPGRSPTNNKVQGGSETSGGSGGAVG